MNFCLAINMMEQLADQTLHISTRMVKNDAQAKSDSMEMRQDSPGNILTIDIGGSFIKATVLNKKGNSTRVQQDGDSQACRT